MNDKIRELLDQIAQLEAQLQTRLHEQESRILFHVKGRRIEFDKDIRAAHVKLKRNILRWLVTDRPLNVITAPIIYCMIIPMLLLDLTVTLYQACCFPIYRIAKVRRSEYIVFDRHHLGYLNFYERLHCEYCAYANGLLAYAVEIVARTEQYFCPIKHARKALGTHARYLRFLDYGEAEDYHARLEEFRKALAKDEHAASAG
jgi:hypothetical protein